MVYSVQVTWLAVQYVEVPTKPIVAKNVTCAVENNLFIKHRKLYNISNSAQTSKTNLHKICQLHRGSQLLVTLCIK